MMRIKLSLKRQYTTRDRDNKDVVVRTIEATREAEIPTEFLPSHFRIGGNDFYSERNLYDLDHGQWVLQVTYGDYSRNDLQSANTYVASLENSGWKIVRDEKSIEVVAFALTRADALALIEVAKEGLAARGVTMNQLRWNEHESWSTMNLEDALQRVCRNAAAKSMM